ncbi:MAG: hypothetical protein PHZ11_10320, partial [Desulfitobacteriaceae bacterium]|nr:hypothetical protein [Desulfitobacteriaceae bacterium]
MGKKIIGYFQDSNQASQAVNELKAKGFNEISLLGNEKGGIKGGNEEDTGNRDMSLGGNSYKGTMTGGTIGG